jgi:hypothetical protein
MLDRSQFIVECKSCRMDVPAEVKEFPFHSLVIACPLCRELRRYLPDLRVNRGSVDAYGEGEQWKDRILTTL